MHLPLPPAGEGTGEGGPWVVSPSPQSSPPFGGEEVFGLVFHLSRVHTHDTKFVRFLSLHCLCFRRIQDRPEFIEVAKGRVSLSSNFFNHADNYSRIILLTAIDSKNVVFQNCPFFFYDALVKSRLTGENRCPVFF